MILNVHAGHNPDGKVGCGAVGHIKESTEARKVRDVVIAGLRAQGHTVYDCTVDDGTSQSQILSKIVSKCNAHTVDLDVSIHFNSASSASAGGTEVWTYPNGGAGDYATRVVNEIAALGFKNRGVKSSSDLYYLRSTKAKAILIECCFVTNAQDCVTYDATKMGNAIVKGITGQAVSSKSTELDYSLVFDADYYLSKYSDLKKAYKSDKTAALKHFKEYGMKEGRCAHPLFNVDDYASNYADLRKAFGNDKKAYYNHFITCGYSEGRNGIKFDGYLGTANTLDGVNYSAVYNYNYYVARNPDVKSAYGYDDVATLKHFVTNGMKEGRCAHPRFVVGAYKSNYSDLQKAYGNDLEKYYRHFIDYGYKEKRIAYTK